MNFSRRKFLQLELRVQHKKCSETLRQIYEQLLQKKNVSSLYEIYHQYIDWMNLKPFETEDLKHIADRYHWHIERAVIFLKEHNLLPHIRKGDHEPKKEFPEIAVYLDNIRSAYNVGSILRTTEALRVSKVYFAQNTPFISNEKVQKVAMGSAEVVPCFQDVPLKDLPRPIIALETSKDAQPVSKYLFPKTFTLILGNEEYGISEESLKECDSLIEIPLYGMKNSINVAGAYSIAAAEIRRQLDEVC